MMNPSSAEIESIVRRVLTQLSQSAALSPASSGPAPLPSTTVELQGKVITLESLRLIPSGTTSIEVGSKSIVTPAVQDWLRERRIGLVRRAGRVTSTEVHAGKSAPMWICGKASWMRSLQKAACPLFSYVELDCPDESASLLRAREQIRSGRKWIWLISDHPYATSWQVSRDDAVRAVVVRDGLEVTEALKQVPVNLFVAPSNNWTSHTTHQAIRTIERWHQASRSSQLVGFNSVGKGGN